MSWNQIGVRVVARRLAWFKCGQLFMASQSDAGRGIHSSVSLPTCLPPLLGSATPNSEIGAVGFDRGWALSGLTYPPLTTD
jgi:hypothetical protein